MTRLDPEPGTAAPGARIRAAAGRGPTRALLLLATLAVAASALFIAQAGARPTIAPAPAPRGITTLNVADAAAVAATSAGSIQIKNYAFAPASATVPTGVEVTWVNEDSVPHTVTSKSGPASFDSGQIAPGASYSAIFETPGTYTYYCIDHPQMTATITVTGPSGGGSPSPAPSGVPSSLPSGAPSSMPSSAPSGAPSGGPTGGMSMPASSTASSGAGGVLGSIGGGSSGSGGCASLSQVLLPLLQHVDTTHLGESPGQQVNDLLNVNQYVLTHTTLVENTLIPAWNTANRAVTGLLVPLLQHVDTTHLGESPGQQVNDLLNLDQYVLTHTTLVESMIAPTEGALIGAC